MVGNDNHYILCLLTETHFYNRCILDPEFDAIVSGWSRAVCRVIIALYAFDLCTRKFKMIHLLCSLSRKSYINIVSFFGGGWGRTYQLPDVAP